MLGKMERPLYQSLVGKNNYASLRIFADPAYASLQRSAN